MGWKVDILRFIDRATNGPLQQLSLLFRSFALCQQNHLNIYETWHSGLSCRPIDYRRDLKSGQCEYNKVENNLNNYHRPALSCPLWPSTAIQSYPRTTTHIHYCSIYLNCYSLCSKSITNIMSYSCIPDFRVQNTLLNSPSNSTQYMYFDNAKTVANVSQLKHRRTKSVCTRVDGSWRNLFTLQRARRLSCLSSLRGLLHSRQLAVFHESLSAVSLPDWQIWKATCQLIKED